MDKKYKDAGSQCITETKAAEPHLPQNKERGLSRWQASLLLFLLLLLDGCGNDLSHLGNTLLIGMDAVGLYQFLIIQH